MPQSSESKQRVLTLRIAISTLWLDHRMATKKASGAYAATVFLTPATGLVPPLQVLLVGQAVGLFDRGRFFSRLFKNQIF